MNDYNPVFILGSGVGALGLCRSFSKKKVKVYCFDMIKRTAGFSRFCNFFKLKSSNDKDILNSLISCKTNLKKKPVLFMESDYFLAFFSRNRRAISKNFLIMSHTNKIIECCLDKSKLKKVLPKKYLVKEFKVNSVSDLKRLKFPVMVKPKRRDLFDLEPERSFKTFLLDEKNLDEFVKQYTSKLNTFIFQELVDAKKSDIIHVVGYINSERKQVYSIERLRSSPFKGGSASLLKLDSSCNFRILNCFDGIFEMEVFYSKSCSFIVDINLRVPTWAGALLHKVGPDIFTMYYNDLTGLSLPLRESKEEGKSVWFIEDFFSIFSPKSGAFWKGQIGFFEYLNSLRGVKHFYVFDMADIKPFLYEFYTKLKFW